MCLPHGRIRKQEDDDLDPKVRSDNEAKTRRGHSEAS